MCSPPANTVRSGSRQVALAIRSRCLRRGTDLRRLLTGVRPRWLVGGPLWGGVEGQFRVVGIESGFENDFLDPERTVFAGGEHMVNLVKYGWANWA